MKGPTALFESENNLVTDMGAWFPGERVVFRGKDLHHDLADMSWMELFFFGITGRTFTADALNVLSAMWRNTSYPDPRLWNNRVAALAGSTRSTGNLGFSAALAVSEASIYGRRLDIEAIDFLLRIKRIQDEGNIGIESIVVAELKLRRRIAGFGRPVTKMDERLAPLLETLRDLGFGNGPHVRLVTEIETIIAPYRLQANYAAFCAAFCADLGLTAKEYYLFSLLAFSAGMPPCYIDQANKPVGTLFPLRCEQVACEAVANRQW